MNKFNLDMPKGRIKEYEKNAILLSSPDFLIPMKFKVSLQRHNHKSQQKTEPTYTKTSLFQEKGGVFSWPGLGKEWC